ncbi:amidohydrolase [Alicyclobacillus sp. SO9]|uniref:amidohydrolase n=1 Tax=Alicyclobacillus sp. SO9 TaxID=2665646 RepID=UPI001E4FCFC1|nr:amidohydrolase [Alicyclobacillus sp. SO9]
MNKFILETGWAVCSAADVRDEPTYFVVEDGIIQEIGSGTVSEPNGIPVIKRPNSVAMPGLVNTHGHAAMTLLRGAGDDLPLMQWLSEKVYPNEAKLNGEAVYWGTMLAALEMIMSGTTTFTDMYFFMHDAARAVEEAGLRGVLSWGMVGFSEADREKGILQSTEFANRWNGAANGRIRVTLGPHAPYTCPPEYLTEIAELSTELDVPVQIHLSETKGEVEDSIKQFGYSPIANAQRTGLLDRPVLAAHCVHLSEADIQILQQHRVRVAHNPQSNLKLGSGVAPVTKLLKAGVRVGLGTDGAASNNNLDMFEEMRLAATLHKGVLMDATAVTAPQAFSMATEEGAKCAFLEEQHGTLTKGAQADIVLLSHDSPHFWPNHNLLSNIVYASGADDVTDVFVQGRQLLSNRVPQTIDVERVQFEVGRIEQLLKS